MMNRIAATFTLSLLGACSLHQEPKLVASKVQPLELSLGLISSAPTCRVAADDGPVVADRGIGGTGAPQGGQATQRVADRGIGGTGIIANAIAETAIVGVVTGFASICVDGLEVQYDSAATVDLDGTSVPVSVLRAGQMVVIQAQGTPASPRAQALSVRRAVVGRVDAIDPRSGLLTIAGQPVSVSPDTRGSRHSHVGDWIAVSGLRQADGTIIASRVDSAPATKFLVRGQVMRDGDIVRIGTRVVQGSVLAGVTSGQFVTASGHYTAGPLDVESVSADTLWFDPASFFGPSVNRIVLQAFVRVGDNIISFNGLHVPLSPNLRGQADPEGMAVVSLDRMVDGSLIAVGLHYMDYRGSVTGSERIAHNSWLQNLLAIWNGSVPGARGLMIRRHGGPGWSGQRLANSRRRHDWGASAPASLASGRGHTPAGASCQGACRVVHR